MRWFQNSVKSAWFLAWRLIGICRDHLTTTWKVTAPVLAHLLPPDAVCGKWRWGDCNHRLTEFVMEDIPVPKENLFQPEGFG